MKFINDWKSFHNSKASLTSPTSTSLENYSSAFFFEVIGNKVCIL